MISEYWIATVNTIAYKHVVGGLWFYTLILNSVLK